MKIDEEGKIEESCVSSQDGDHSTFLIQSSENVQSNSKKFQCGVCGKIERSDEHLKVHLRNHELESGCPVKFIEKYCYLCNKNFTNAGHLKSHIVVHTGDRHYRCDFCAKTFTEKSSLTKHTKKHKESNESDQPLRVGNEVKEAFCNQNGLSLHKQSTPEKIPSCKFCSKIFSTHQIMKKHMNTHKCRICDEIIHKKEELNQHMSNMHSKDCDERQFMCHICGNAFKEKGVLKKHLVIHSGIRNYKCEYCTKSFFRAEQLKAHIVTHTGERNFVCEICAKTFVYSNGLSNHIKIVHDGIRAYKCKVCQKQFTHPTTLKHHMLIHSGERKFQCQECGKKFTEKSALTRHSYIHTGVRKHKCTVCSKSFIQQHHLKTHLKTHENKANETQYHSPTTHPTDVHYQQEPISSSLMVPEMQYVWPSRFVISEDKQFINL